MKTDKFCLQLIPISIRNYSFFLFLILLSCKKSDTPSTKKVFEGEIESSVNTLKIDASDLENLAPDTGGVHQAYPLDSTDAEFGYYAYTPSGYSESESSYPLLIFMHGWGERGNSAGKPEELDKVLTFGPPRLIERNLWQPSYPFVVISPQLITEYWPSNQIHKFIEQIVSKYNINSKRIYLTGLSLGGGGCWYYVGEKGNENYAAAILPISASGAEYLVENLSKIPIWAFHGDKDTVVDPFNNYGSVPLVQAINAKNPTVRAKVTVFQNTGHNAWSRAYENTYSSIGISYDPFKVSIYDWMLQYKKD